MNLVERDASGVHRELYAILRRSWYELLREIETLDFGHMTEADLRSRLYHLFTSELKNSRIEQILGLVYTEVKINNRPIDLVVFDPVVEDKVFAGVEIKLDPDPQGIREDLAKLQNHLNRGDIQVGIFVTMATSDYGLRERLKEQRVVDEFGLKEDEKTNRGYVEFSRVERRGLNGLATNAQLTLCS